MSEKMYLKTQTMINDKTKMVSIKAVTSNSLRMYFYFYSTKIAKLREREGQRVDLGRSLKGHLWMVDGGWWISFP